MIRIRAIVIRLVFSVSLLFLASLALFAQPSYRIDRYCGKVYFGRELVYGADARTFRDLGYGYGKDYNNVYRFGEVLEFVDPSSFRVSRRFAARPEHGHPGCPSVPGAGHGHPSHPGYGPGHPSVPGAGNRPGYPWDGDCCKDDRGYLVTRFEVYYNGEKVKDASVSTFKILGYGYAKDAFNVYWRGRVIEDASSSTFRVLEDGYAKDAFETYYMGRELDD